MSGTAIRRIALIWWVKNLQKGNTVRASRWESLVEKYEGEVDA